MIDNDSDIEFNPREGYRLRTIYSSLRRSQGSTNVIYANGCVAMEITNKSTANAVVLFGDLSLEAGETYPRSGGVLRSIDGTPFDTEISVEFTGAGHPTDKLEISLTKYVKV